MSLLVTRYACQCFFAVTHAVRLNVCLCHYVNAILVAKVIPTWVIGIVASAHSVDVVLFHQLNVLHHARSAYNVGTIGVHFVAVYTLNEHGLTINKQLGIFNFNFSETYILLNALQKF